MPLNDKERYFYFIDGERIGVVEKRSTSLGTSNDDPEYTSPIGSSAGKTLRVHYTAKASPLTTTLTESPEIPSQFHEALAFKVISDLYKLPGETLNLELASYYDAQYEMALREAKKYARRQHVSGGQIQPWSF
tara:strand:- start:1125 stop:1523 length:399 start_codon:yes stop_codon:yes gene_type:complete